MLGVVRGAWVFVPVVSYGHVGPRWTVEWIAFAKEEPLFFDQGFSNASLPARVWVSLRGGG